MAIPQGLSDTLTKIAPKRINDAVEKILDILNKVNEAVRKINEIDFCNPLGYILTKALPPGGVLENKMLQYGKKVTDFIKLLFIPSFNFADMYISFGITIFLFMEFKNK